MITYPVDPASRFTFRLDGVTRRGRKWPIADGGPIPVESVNPNQIIMEELVAEPPPYDTATEKLVWSWVDDPADEKTTLTATAVALSQEELDEVARNAALADQQAQAKAVYVDLKNGVGTAGERATRLEQVVAWLLKREFSDLD